MKIAIIGSRGYPYVYSGYETFVREIGERLHRRGVEVTVYCHRNLFRERPPRVNGIRLVYIPTIERKSLSQFLHSLQAMLHASWGGKYDVILTLNAANGPFGLIPRLRHRPTAINVDGLEWLRPKWRGLGARYFRWAARCATRFYDRVITDSTEMERVYRREFGVDSTMIAYGATPREQVDDTRLQRWNLEKNGYYLIVGRLIPDNNADLLIREFLRTGSSRKLVVVGDVPYRDRYAQALKEIADPRLVFTGYIHDLEDLAALYQHCHVYLHGHEFGGTNPTLLQALAHDCAVLALDTPFSREVLAGEEHGLHFGKQEGELARRIAEVESRPHVLESMRRRGHERIREAYDWEMITDRYMQLLQELARPTAPRGMRP